MEEYKVKKIPWLLILSFILLLGVGLGCGYYYTQTNLLDGQLETIDKEILEVNNQVTAMETNETVAAQRAVTSLQIIEKEQVLWSKILTELNTIVPLDLIAKQPYITFSSYSGGEGGKLTFNGHTIPSSNVKKQLNDIADTISAFNKRPVFENTFVPSISKSITQEDKTVLNVIFNTDYVALQLDSAEEEESVTEESEAPEVPELSLPVESLDDSPAAVPRSN